MKVTVKRVDDTQEVKYPCLMETQNGTIVLFIDEERGTVIQDPHNYYMKGHYSSGWTMSCFTPFKGTVTLQND